MRFGHIEAQRLFLALGKSLGYETRKTHSKTYPTDGIWSRRSPLSVDDGLPVVAIEVIVSEAPKTVRGSVATLELVSPALAVILLHEEEIRKHVIKRGGTIDRAQKAQAIARDRVDTLISRSKQNFEVWTMDHLRLLHALSVGRQKSKSMKGDLS